MDNPFSVGGPTPPPPGVAGMTDLPHHETLRPPHGWHRILFDSHRLLLRLGAVAWYDWTLLAPTPVPPSQKVLGGLGFVSQSDFGVCE